MLLNEFITQKTPFAEWQKGNSEQFTTLFKGTTGVELDKYISVKYGFRCCVYDDADELYNYLKSYISLNAPVWIKQIKLLENEYTGGYRSTRTEERTGEQERNATATDANKAFNDTEFTDDTQRKDVQTDTHTQTTTINESKEDNDPNKLLTYLDIMKQNVLKSVIFAIVSECSFL